MGSSNLSGQTNEASKGTDDARRHEGDNDNSFPKPVPAALGCGSRQHWQSRSCCMFPVRCVCARLRSFCSRKPFHRGAFVPRPRIVQSPVHRFRVYAGPSVTKACAPTTSVTLATLVLDSPSATRPLQNEGQDYDSRWAGRGSFVELTEQVAFLWRST